MPLLWRRLSVNGNRIRSRRLLLGDGRLRRKLHLQQHDSVQWHCRRRRIFNQLKYLHLLFQIRLDNPRRSCHFRLGVCQNVSFQATLSEKTLVKPRCLKQAFDCTVKSQFSWHNSTRTSFATLFLAISRARKPILAMKSLAKKSEVQSNKGWITISTISQDDPIKWLMGQGTELPLSNVGLSKFLTAGTKKSPEVENAWQTNFQTIRQEILIRIVVWDFETLYSTLSCRLCDTMYLWITFRYLSPQVCQF